MPSQENNIRKIKLWSGDVKYLYFKRALQKHKGNKLQYTSVGR